MISSGVRTLVKVAVESMGYSSCITALGPIWDTGSDLWVLWWAGGQEGELPSVQDLQPAISVRSSAIMRAHNLFKCQMKIGPKSSNRSKRLQQTIAIYVVISQPIVGTTREHHQQIKSRKCRKSAPCVPNVNLDDYRVWYQWRSTCLMDYLITINSGFNL